MTLNERVPFNIKILLIDNIINRYYSSSFDIFEDEVSLLSIDIILKIFSSCDNKEIFDILGKLCEYNHPIIKDKETLFNLLKRGCNIIPFINLDELTLKEINEIKKYLHIDLDSDKVRVKLHPNINNKYKFEYENEEMLPNGINREAFLKLKLNNKYDKFLFEFLIYSSDIELLYTNYYNSYRNSIIKKYGEEKFKKLDDIYNFMKFVLTEIKLKDELVMPNLEIIYQKLNLTNNQVRHIKELMVTIDSKYEERINRFLIRQRNMAISKYNAIVRMHLDGINISEALSKLGLKKDEVISQIIKMRNLDKKEKKTLINLLKEEKYVITIGDILGILQEMEENDYTIDEILRLNGINKKYFYTIYKELIYTNPELHAKIKEALLNNKKKGFKKYIRLAYYITTFEFNNEDDFKTMFPNINLDKIIEDMEKIDNMSIVSELCKIRENIKNKQKTI